MSSAIMFGFIALGEASRGEYNSRKREKKIKKNKKYYMDLAIKRDDERYAETQTNLMPYIQGGTAAQGRLDRASTGDMSDFNVSPGYQFRMDEGQRNEGNMFSATGGGGNAVRAMEEFRQGLASSEFGNWWNRQAGEANRGAAAASNLGQFGAGNAARVGAQYSDYTDDLASIGLYTDAQNAQNYQAAGNSLAKGFGAANATTEDNSPNINWGGTSGAGGSKQWGSQNGNWNGLWNNPEQFARGGNNLAPPRGNSLNYWRG